MAPDPCPLPAERMARREQFDEQTRALVHTHPAGVFAERRRTLGIGFSAFPLYLEPYQRQDWVRKGLPDTPPATGPRDAVTWGNNICTS